MRNLVAVVTCPALRPGYVRDTCCRLDRAGAAWAERLLVVDGPADRLPTGMGWPRAHLPGGPSGTRAAMLFALRAALDFGPWAKLLLTQDDVRPATHAVDVAFSVELRDCAFALLCDVFGQAPGPGPDIYRLPVAGTEARTVASCALVMPRAFATTVLVQENLLLQGGPHDSDRMWYHVAQNWPHPSYKVVVPSLFDHVGEESTLHPGAPIRRSRSFAGR